MIVKILIRGGPQSGKTSLFRALQGLDFDPTYTPTEQLQISHVPWTPQSSTAHLSAQEFLRHISGNTVSTQFRLNSRIDVDVGVDVELVDCIDNGKRPIIPPNKLPNKTSLPPNIDCIDGVYYSPPVDSTTVDVWKNSNVVLLCIDPFKVETYHYAVSLLQSIPVALLQQGLSVVICLIRRDEPPVDRTVTDHMLTMLTTGTSIKILPISSKNGYGVDKLRHFLLIPYLTHQSNEFFKLAELYKSETQLVSTFMSQILIHDDYQGYVRTIQQDAMHATANQQQGNSLGSSQSTADYDDFMSAAPSRPTGTGNRFDAADDELDDIGMKPKKTASNAKAGSKGASRWDDDDDDLDMMGGRSTTSKGKGGSAAQSGLKIANDTKKLSDLRKENQNSGLDDFFGGSAGSSFFDGSDDILPVAKPKKKKKKAIEEDETPAPVKKTAKPAAKAAAPSMAGGFFDDDLDLEPTVAPKRAAKKTTPAVQPAPIAPKPQAFGGFYDDDDLDQQQQPRQTAPQTQQRVESIEPTLLRPSSSHHIDEEAELAFFDDEDQPPALAPHAEDSYEAVNNVVEPEVDVLTPDEDNLFDETNSLLNASIVDDDQLDALEHEIEDEVVDPDVEVAEAVVQDGEAIEDAEDVADEVVVQDMDTNDAADDEQPQEEVEIVDLEPEEDAPLVDDAEQAAVECDEVEVVEAELIQDQDGEGEVEFETIEIEEIVEVTDDEDAECVEIVEIDEVAPEEQEPLQEEDNLDDAEAEVVETEAEVVEAEAEAVDEQLPDDEVQQEAEVEEQTESLQEEQAPEVELEPESTPHLDEDAQEEEPAQPSPFGAFATSTPAQSKGGFYSDDEDEPAPIKPAKSPKTVQTPAESPIPSRQPKSPQKGFFDDDEELVAAPTTPVVVQSSPQVAQKPSSGGFFDDDDDVIPAKSPSGPTSSPSPPVSGFFDDDDAPIAPRQKSPSVQQSPQIKPSLFEFDDQDDAMPTPTLGKKKKVVGKKQSELEKQMSLLQQQEEEKKKKSEKTAGDFTFKARSGGSFYD